MDQDIIEKYRKAGRISGIALDYGLSLIREGGKLLDVARSVEKKIVQLGGAVAFPINIAIDDQAAHYTPCVDDTLTFKKGMIVKLDVGAHLDGYIGDTASTVEVGSNHHSMLIQASRQALTNAIDIIKPGVLPKTIGAIIENTIRSFGFKPISNLTGHGLDRYKLHSGLSIPNVARKEGRALMAGDTIAIEPFATDGGGRVIEQKKSNIYHFKRKKRTKDIEADKLLEIIASKSGELPFSERWCHKYVENPGRLLKKLVQKGTIYSYPILGDVCGGVVSQAEHSLLITENGCEILTKT